MSLMILCPNQFAAYIKPNWPKLSRISKETNPKLKFNKYSPSKAKIASSIIIFVMMGRAVPNAPSTTVNTTEPQNNPR
ncbi:MAG: Uncharacterised protein [Flavobacteriales bacterium UBA4585]|nr:MAG: Uncharacterised protein [Flavobacteriales bacterium UBA4585]